MPESLDAAELDEARTAVEQLEETADFAELQDAAELFEDAADFAELEDLAVLLDFGAEELLFGFTSGILKFNCQIDFLPLSETTTT